MATAAVGPCPTAPWGLTINQTNVPGTCRGGDFGWGQESLPLLGVRAGGPRIALTQALSRTRLSVRLALSVHTLLPAGGLSAW